MAGFQYSKQGQGAFESDSLRLGQSLLRGRKKDRNKKLLALILQESLKEGRASLLESIQSKTNDAAEWFKRTESDLRETYNVEHFPMLQDARKYQLSPDTHNRQKAETMFLEGTDVGKRIVALGGIERLNPDDRRLANELIQERRDELNQPLQNFIDEGLLKSAGTFRQFSEPAYQVLQKQYESIKNNPANRNLFFNIIDKVPFINKVFTKGQLQLESNLDKAEAKYKNFEEHLAKARNPVPYQPFSEEKLKQLAGVIPTGQGITPENITKATKNVYEYLTDDARKDELEKYTLHLYSFNNKLELPKYNQTEIDTIQDWDSEKYGPKPKVGDIKKVNDVGKKRNIFAPFSDLPFEIAPTAREDLWEVREIIDKNTDDTFKLEKKSNVDPLHVYSNDIAKIYLRMVAPYNTAIQNSYGAEKDAAIERKPSNPELFDKAIKEHAELGHLVVDPTTDKLILIPLSENHTKARLMNPEKQNLANFSADIEEGVIRVALDGEEVVDSLLQTVEQELLQNADNISTDELTKIERSKRDENQNPIDSATRDASILSLLLDPPEALQGTYMKFGETALPAGGLEKSQISQLYNAYMEAYGRNLELESLMDSVRLPTSKELRTIGRGPRPTVGGVIAGEVIERTPPAWTRQLDREARARLQNYVDTGRKSQFLKDALERFNLPADASTEVVNNFLTQSSQLVSD